MNRREMIKTSGAIACLPMIPNIETKYPDNTVWICDGVADAHKQFCNILDVTLEDNPYRLFDKSGKHIAYVDLSIKGNCVVIDKYFGPKVSGYLAISGLATIKDNQLLNVDVIGVIISDVANLDSRINRVTIG